MCIHILHLAPKIAKTNKICYKVIAKEGERYKSPIQGATIILDAVLCEKYFDIRENMGFHTFNKKEDAINFVPKLSDCRHVKPFRVIKAIIPKGSYYYDGIDDWSKSLARCSNQIFYPKQEIK